MIHSKEFAACAACFDQKSGARALKEPFLQKLAVELVILSQRSLSSFYLCRRGSVHVANNGLQVTTVLGGASHLPGSVWRALLERAVAAQPGAESAAPCEHAQLHMTIRRKPGAEQAPFTPGASTRRHELF